MHGKTFTFGEEKLHFKFVLALVFWTGCRKEGTGIGDKEDKENLHLTSNISFFKGNMEKYS